MGEGSMIDLRIHIGGSMEKHDGEYKYIGELMVSTVRWELYDISWAKLVRFSREHAKILAPIRFVWYKERAKEMNTVNYVFDDDPNDMLMLICLGKEVAELEIFIEHDVSDVRGGDGMDEEYLESDEEGEVDRPMEDEEPEKSEDENQEDEEAEEPLVDEAVVEEAEAQNVFPQADIGAEVVKDAGDGSQDDRFMSVFEEGSKAKPGKEAYLNLEEKEAATREAEESDEECVLEEEADYPQGESSQPPTDD